MIYLFLAWVVPLAVIAIIVGVLYIISKLPSKKAWKSSKQMGRIIIKSAVLIYIFFSSFVASIICFFIYLLYNQASFYFLLYIFATVFSMTAVFFEYFLDYLKYKFLINRLTTEKYKEKKPSWIEKSLYVSIAEAIVNHYKKYMPVRFLLYFVGFAIAIITSFFI